MSRPDLPALYDEDGARRWDDLVAEMLGSGEVTAEQLDVSVASLRTVWGWLLPRLQLRPAEEPVDETVQPPWWSGGTWGRYAAWDDTTHYRLSGVTHHLRRVLLAQPDAVADLGEPGTRKAGEPVVSIGDQLPVNPLGEVLLALADVWNGRPDPDALAQVVLRPPYVMPPDLLYSKRLVVRLQAPARGLLRRRRDLDGTAVLAGLRELLQQPVEPSSSGSTSVEHLGAGDWRALFRLQTERDRLTTVEVVIGAHRDDPQPWPDGYDPETPAIRGRAVRTLLHALLALADRVGADLDVVEAVPDDGDAPRPTGRLQHDDIEHVLQAVEL